MPSLVKCLEVLGFYYVCLFVINFYFEFVFCCFVLFGFFKHNNIAILLWASLRELKGSVLIKGGEK